MLGLFFTFRTSLVAMERSQMEDIERNCEISDNYWSNLDETFILLVILSLLDESRNTTTQFTTPCI